MGKAKKASEIPGGFRCLGLIKHLDEERRQLTMSDVETLKKAFPSNADFMAPNPLFSSDFVSDEWVCFFENPFALGLEFPFPTVITRFFKSSKLAYAQLMPVGWRALVALGKLSEETGLQVDLEELAFWYVLKAHGNSRYGFRVKNKAYSLVVESVDKDIGWKNRFFYVKKSSLEGGEGLVSEWNSKVTKLEELFPKKEDTLVIVEKICALPSARRRFVKPVESSSGEEENAEDIQEASGCAHKMSSVTRSQSGFGAKDLMAMVRGRVKVEGSKPPVPKLDIGEDKLNKKRKAKEIVDVETAIPVERKYENKVVKAVGFLVNEVKVSKEKAEASFKKMYEAEERAKVAERELDEKDKEFRDMTLRFVKVNQDHGKEMEILHNQCMNDAAKSLFEMRIQMIKEHQPGKQSEWNLDEEYEALKKITGEAVDGEEVTSKVPVVDQGEQVGENQEKKVDGAT